jgi:hypothetical protein
MFHVDKKKFKTSDEVINYLDSSNEDPIAPEESKGMKDEFNKDAEDIEEFESKSYKRTFESFKRKK